MSLKYFNFTEAADMAPVIMANNYFSTAAPHTASCISRLELQSFNFNQLGQLVDEVCSMDETVIKLDCRLSNTVIKILIDPPNPPSTIGIKKRESTTVSKVSSSIQRKLSENSYFVQKPSTRQISSCFKV